MAPRMVYLLGWYLLAVLAAGLTLFQAHGQEILLRPVPQTAAAQPCGTTILSSAAPCDCDPGWSFRYIAYSWLTAQNGDLTLRGRTASVDVDYGKTLDLIFNDLDFMFLGQAEATNGTFGFLVNGVYSKVEPGGQIQNLNFDSSYAQTILDMAFTYRLAGASEALGMEGSRVELLGGIRYNALSGGLTLMDSQGQTASVNGTEEWCDLIFGTRVTLPLNSCWTLQLRGDIGGFDLGTSSKFTFNLEALAEYHWTEHCSLVGGWRWLHIDRENGAGSMQFGYDIGLNGPILGLAFNF